MPCIWGSHNNSQIFCPVAIIPGNTSLPTGTQSPVLPSTAVFNALIDTGATTTGISSDVVARLQLQPVGKIPIHGVSGVQHHNSYLIIVGFPFPGAARHSASCRLSSTGTWTETNSN